MKVNLDSQKMDITCPHCGHKFKELIGRLKRDPHLTCAGCRKGFDTNAADLRKVIKSIQDRAEKLSRDIEKMFR